MKQAVIAWVIVLMTSYAPASALAALEADGDPTTQLAAGETSVSLGDFEPAFDFGTRLLHATEHARDLLQSQLDAQLSDPNHKLTFVTSRTAPVEVIVVLWNPDGDEYATVRLLKKGTSVTPILNEAYEFTVLKDNGVNTTFSVANRPDLYVVAVIHPVLTSVGTTAHPKYRLDQTVYVPAADYLLHPSIVKAGRDYLDWKVDAVYRELGELHVRSRAFPDQELANVISPTIVKAIIAIEHVSADALLKGDATAYLNRFYSTLATNEHRAYAYAKSTASARGLVQFIPATYKSLVRTRPELTLNSDFEQGMMDPYNAIKAEIALLDYNLSVLPAAVRNTYEAGGSSLGAYLAAMYNGGETRVRRAIARYGERWAQYHGNTAYGLRRETAEYVAKYLLVYGLLDTKPSSLDIASVAQE
jgi:hypothetical protein